MFVVTLSKTSLKKLGAGAACCALVVFSAMLGRFISTRTVAVAAPVNRRQSPKPPRRQRPTPSCRWTQKGIPWNRDGISGKNDLFKLLSGSCTNCLVFTNDSTKIRQNTDFCSIRMFKYNKKFL